MYLQWERFAAWPAGLILLWVFGKVLAPVSTYIRRHMRGGRLKRFLLTPAGARWGSQQPGDTTDTAVPVNGQQRAVERLPPPL